MHTSHRSFLCLVFSMLLLAGCATNKYGEQITSVHYYPRCYEPLNDLREAESQITRTTLGGTVVGTLAGALLGYMATGRAEGAAVGAAGGAVVGTGVGYAKAKSDRSADDNRRMASYLVDIEGDISGLDRATAAARVARDCYNKEFMQSVTAFKNKSITREELTRRYQEIKDGTKEAEQILGIMIASTSEKERTYQEAISEEARKTNQPVPVVKTASTTATTSSRAAQSTQKGSAARPKAKIGASSSKTRTADITVKKTPPPAKGDASLQAVAQNTQRLNESKSAAEEEQALIREMQAEMDGTLATLTS